MRPPSDLSDKTTVTWVTNHQAPYRTGLWTALAGLCHLEVKFLFAEEKNRHWSYIASDHYSSEVLETRVLPLPGLDKPQDDSRAFLSLKGLSRLIRASDVLILGGWDQPVYLQLAIAAKWHRKPAIAFYESTPTSHRFQTGPIAFVRRTFLRSVALVIAAGPDSKAALLDMGVTEPRIIQTINAVDHSFFGRACQMRKAEPQDGVHRFLYVGQLIPRKNVDGLLRAFAKLPPDSLLTLVGDGEQEGELKQMALGLGISRRVHFAGHLEGDALLSAFAQAQTLVLPTWEDVWGMVVNEGLAAGLNIVVSNRAGVAAAVRHVPHVTVCSPDVDNLSTGLLNSWRTWDTWKPAWAGLSVERMAADVLRSVLLALPT